MKYCVNCNLAKIVWVGNGYKCICTIDNKEVNFYDKSCKEYK